MVYFQLVLRNEHEYSVVITTIINADFEQLPLRRVIMALNLQPKNNNANKLHTILHAVNTDEGVLHSVALGAIYIYVAL